MLDPELLQPPAIFTPSLSPPPPYPQYRQHPVPCTLYTPRTPGPSPQYQPSTTRAQHCILCVTQSQPVCLGGRNRVCPPARCSSSVLRYDALASRPMGTFFLQKKGGRVCFLIAHHPLLRWWWWWIGGFPWLRDLN